MTPARRHKYIADKKGELSARDSHSLLRSKSHTITLPVQNVNVSVFAVLHVFRTYTGIRTLHIPPSSAHNAKQYLYSYTLINYTQTKKKTKTSVTSMGHMTLCVVHNNHTQPYGSLWRLTPHTLQRPEEENRKMIRNP